MKIPVLWVTSIFLAGSIGAGASTARPLFGPKGEFSTLLYTLEYDPSRACSKPSRPYNDDEFALQLYKNSAVRYVKCMGEAANADAEYAQAVIQEGHDEAVEEFMNELRRRY